MKTRHALLLALAALAPALRAETQTGAHAYVQASAIYVEPGPDFKSAGGAALAVGISFKRNHAIEIEGIAFNSKLDNKGPYYVGDKNDVRFKHFLLTYRYTFSITEQFKLFAAASAGLANVKYDSRNTSYYYVYLRSGSDNAAAGAAQFGCAYEFTPQSAVTASTKLVYQASTDVTTSGSIAMLQLGYRHSF